MGMIFQCKREGNPQWSPCRGRRIRSLSQGREQRVGQFQLHFPFDDGKTGNRMEFPVNSSSPCKLSINKYSGLDPNRECRGRRGNWDTDQRVPPDFIWTFTEFIRTGFYSNQLRHTQLFVKPFHTMVIKSWQIKHQTSQSKSPAPALGRAPKSQRYPGMSQAGAPGRAKLFPKSCRGAELCQRDPGGAGFGLVWDTWKWDEYGQIWTKIHIMECLWE